MSELKPDNSVWKSYVFYKDKCWFVSTISRDFDTATGTLRGLETLTWEYNWAKAERGNWVHQAGGLDEHIEICRSLIATGEFPKEDEKEA